MTLAIYGPAKDGGNGIYRSPTAIADVMESVPITARRVFRPWRAASGNAIFDAVVGIPIVQGGGYPTGRKKAAVKAAPSTRAATRQLAEQLTKASKLTKTAKKKRREEVEKLVFELQPDAQPEFAESIAQAVVRREAQLLATHPAEAMQFDPQPVVQQMLQRWSPMQPIRWPHVDDESEIEMLLLG